MKNNINKITQGLAELLGLLCAEGSHVIAYSSHLEKSGGKLRFHKNKKSERIGL